MMRSPITTATAFLLGLLLLTLTACGEEAAAPFSGTRRTPAPTLASTLPTAAGDEFAFIADEGNVLVVYFGYTSCPDVCPTTMADVSFARNELGDRGELIDLAMITIDPNRDSAEILNNYVNSFVPGSTAVRTDNDDELQAAASEFGVFYQVDELEDGTIDVAHSGTLFAVDDQGKLTASWPFGTPAADLLNDLDILLSETEDNA